MDTMSRSCEMMEPHDVVDITVDLGIYLIDGILFQKQFPEDISARDSSSSSTNSYIWFAMSKDGLNHDISKSVKSTNCEHLTCTEDGNEKDVLTRKSISAQESAIPSGSEQVKKDLSPNQNDEQKRGRTKQDSTTSSNVNFIQLRTDIDPILASCFMCAMRHSQVYGQLFLNNLYAWCRSSKRQKRSNGIRLALDLRQSNLFKMEPDIRWSKKMLPLWLARISMEDSFSWLSTLGGAYSALGDDFQDFAEKAGKVSIHQMKLACQIGDPILLARCRVYMAQSLMQKGFIEQAMFIVRAQYRFAISLGDNTDQRLINMCMGVWSIIQYIHRRKRKRRGNGVGLHPASSEAR